MLNYYNLLSKLLIASTIFVAGCDKLSQSSVKGTLGGFTSVNSAERSIGLACVEFMQNHASGWTVVTSTPGGAFTMTLKGKEYEIIIKTKTVQVNNGSYEIAWECSCTGKNQKENENMARLIRDLIVRTSNQTPSSRPSTSRTLIQ